MKAVLQSRKATVAIVSFLLMSILCLSMDSISEIESTNKIDCIRMQDSIYAHLKECKSSRPMPLKVESTFQMDLTYKWDPYLSFSIYLVDANMHKTSLGSKCFKGTPSEGIKNKGENLTLSLTCNTLPRELAQYDFVEYEIYFNSTSQYLYYGIPLPGYSTRQEIQKYYQIRNSIPMLKQQYEEKENQQRKGDLREQTENHERVKDKLDTEDQVECIRMQDSPYAHYSECKSSKPLPVEIEVTFTMDLQFSWDKFGSYSMYLVDGKINETVIAWGCWGTVPETGRRKPGDNLTISINCPRLPRELVQYDFIEFVIFFYQRSQWLRFGVPLPGYSSRDRAQQYARRFYTEREQLPQIGHLAVQKKEESLNQIIDSLGKEMMAATDKVDCIDMAQCEWAHFTQCKSSKPMPVNVQTTFTLDHEMDWSQNTQHWFLLKNFDLGTSTLISNFCMVGIPRYGHKEKGQNMTFKYTCNSLPRNLVEADFVAPLFLLDDYEVWLQYGIPLPGYTTSQQIREYYRKQAEIPKIQQQKLIQSLREAKKESQNAQGNKEESHQRTHIKQSGEKQQQQAQQNQIKQLAIRTVKCIRQQDSAWGHYIECKSSHPLPLKVETTVTLDKDFNWEGFWSFVIYLVDAKFQKIVLQQKCFMGRPAQGQKKAGENLTLSITCNTLPRDLAKYDFVMFLFLIGQTVNDWLYYGIPLPGYSTSQQVQQYITRTKMNQPEQHLSKQSKRNSNLNNQLNEVEENSRPQSLAVDYPSTTHRDKQSQIDSAAQEAQLLKE